MSNKEQVYSLMGGKYYALHHLMDNLRYLGYKKGERAEVWEADKREWKHSDFINLESIMQDMQAVAMDKCGEIAEEYLNDVKTVDAEELEKYLEEWFNKNAKLNFYGVENPRKVVVVVE